MHQRNWPETLGEREYIGDIPVASLREVVVSSSTSGASSRRSSVDKSPSMAPLPSRLQLPVNLSPIAGSREVTFKETGSPEAKMAEVDTWRGHYRGVKFTRVGIIPPISVKDASPTTTVDSSSKGLLPPTFLCIQEYNFKEALYSLWCGANRLGDSGVHALGDNSAFVNQACQLLLPGGVRPEWIPSA